MNFDQQLIITLIDKGLLALIIALAGYVLDSLLERQRAKSAIQQALAPMRAKALSDLWSKTEKLNFSNRQDLTPDIRKELFQELTKWYYDESGAMFLSHKATGLFLGCRDLLLKDSVNDKMIRDSFSTLRTQLKVDSGFYTLSQAKTPLRKDIGL
jgi:hypothetical protein